MEKALKEIAKILKSIDGRLKSMERHFKSLSRETIEITQVISDEQAEDDG